MTQYQVTARDRKAIFDTANRLGVDPYEFGAVLHKESTFNPNIWGGAGDNYYGIIQFGGPERKEAGLDPNKIGSYTIEEQMPHVEKWLRGRGFKNGMGVDRLYNTILGGNPYANMNSPDANNTTVNNSLKGFRKGGYNYTEALKVLGPTDALSQTPTQTAAAATGTGSRTQTDPKTPGYSPRKFLMDFMQSQLEMIQDQQKSMDVIANQNDFSAISAEDAMSLFPL